MFPLKKASSGIIYKNFENINTMVSDFSITTNAYCMCTYIFKTFCILMLNDGSLNHNV